MANKNSCPKGGEHDLEQLTGFWGGLHCIKCGQEESGYKPEPLQDPCPKGGQHQGEKSMGHWGVTGGRKCVKCDERF